MALFFLSDAFWFLPAGLRIAALCLTPTRYWRVLAVLEWGVILALSALSVSHSSVLSLVLTTFGPWLAYAFVLRTAGMTSLVAFTPKAMVRVLTAGVAASVVTSLLLTFANVLNTGEASDAGQRLMAFAIADYLGVVTVLPIAKIVWDFAQGARETKHRVFARGAVAVPAAVFMLVCLLPFADATRYPVMLATPALLWIGHVHGWRPAAVSIALLSLAVHLMGHDGTPSWLPGQLHLVAGVVFSASLLLGATSDALRNQSTALARSVDLLETRTQDLRDTATRLASQQEKERRRLGTELHDELGQDMTAISTRLRLVERRMTDPATRADLAMIRHLVGSAQVHLRDVVAHLHPLALDRFGLARALSVGPVAELAHSQGVDFRCIVQGPADRLPMDVATALYRICQEAVTNGVRHGCGDHLHIHLLVDEVGPDLQITLQVDDDAGPIAYTGTRSGHGLQGIRDRANALDAVYRFNEDEGTPRHWLQARVAASAQRGLDGGSDAGPAA